jgi:cytochrome P450 family 135
VSRVASRAALPAGPRLPRAWQLARYQVAPIGFMEACAARYGSVFTLRMHGIGDVVVVTDPADIRTVLTRAADRFVDHATVRVFEPIVGPSALMLSTGAAHERQRQALQPAFQRRVVERWSSRIAAIAEAELGRLPVGRPVAMHEPMRRIALGVICELVLGIDEPRRRAQLRAAIHRRLGPELVLLSCFPTLWRRDGRLNPGRRLKRDRDMVHRMLLSQIVARRADPRRAKRDDALSLFVGARDDPAEVRLGDLELRDQLVALLLAGHDTTAASLAWALELISRAPSAQARLVRELDDGGETEYLSATIRETLRVRPSVVDVPRTTVAELQLGDHRIPPGTRVNAVLALGQRRADLWDRPLEFRPERFLDGRPVPYAFVPFGGGNRGCIAAALATLQLQVVLRAVLRRFVVQPGPWPHERARLAGVTLVPAHGARMILRLRR